MADGKRKAERLYFVKLSTGAIAALTQKEYQEYKKEQQGETMEDETVSTMPTGEQK